MNQPTALTVRPASRSTIEADILGTVLQEGAVWWRKVEQAAMDQSIDDLFRNPDHRVIAEALHELYESGTPITITTATEKLARNPEIGRSTLADLVLAATLRSAEDIASAVKSLAVLTPPTLIGFGGKKKHGKDAAANHLAARDPRTVVIGFSDSLHQFAQIVNPLVDSTRRYNDVVDAVGFVEAKKTEEVVNILIGVGNGLRALYGKNAIIDRTEDVIRQHMAAGYSVIATGVRFPGEVALIERLGGTTVYVNRPGFVDDTAHANDATETSVSARDFQFVVQNDGTLADLYTTVDDLLSNNELVSA